MGQGQGTLVIDSIDSCACHYSASFAVFTGAEVMVLAVFVGEAIAEAAVPFGFSFDAEISHLTFTPPFSPSIIARVPS